MKNRMCCVIKNFPREVHIMTSTEGITAFSLGAFYFLQILYYNYVELLPRQIGLLYSISAIAGITGFFMGPYVKKLGRKNVMCAGFYIIAVGIVFHMLFKNYLLLLIGQCFVGVGNAFVAITDLQLLYDYANGVNECCAYSYKYSVNLIASALGSLIAGNISRMPHGHTLGYSTLFLISIVLIIIGTSVRFFKLPKPMKVIPLSIKKNTSLKDVKGIILNSEKIKRFSILLFIASLSFSGVGTYNNLILKLAFGFQNNTISIIAFIITVLSMGAVIYMPEAIDKIGVQKFNIIVFIVIISSCYILSLNLRAAYFVPVLIIRCIFAILICSSLDSLMMSNVDEDERDIFASVKLIANSISTAIGNFIGGEILNYFGYRYNYFYGGTVLVFGAVFFYVKVKKYMLNEKIEGECNCNCKVKRRQSYYR